MHVIRGTPTVGLLRQFRSFAILVFLFIIISAPRTFALSYLWQVFHPDPNSVFTAPAMGGNGVIYTTAGDSLFAVQQDGQVIWKYVVTNLTASSTASVALDGTIYVGDSSGRLHAVSPVGTNMWVFAGRGQIRTAIAIGLGGNLFFSTLDGYSYCLDSSGQKIWEKSLYGNTAAIAADGTVYISWNQIHAINPDGNEKWSLPITGGINATPAIGGNGNLFFGAATVGKFYSVSSAGNILWSIPISSGVNQASAIIGLNGCIYFGTSDGTFYSLSPSGAINWSVALGTEIAATPLATADGTLYIGCKDKYLYAYSTNGTFLTKFRATGAPSAGCGVTPSGVILLPNGDNRLYALDNSSPLATAAWPMAQQNPRHTSVGLLSPPITLTSPSADTFFEVGHTIHLGTDVSLSPLPIVTVDYLSNSNVLVTANSTPFEADWTSAAGIHLIQARATDQAGGSGWSAPARIKIVAPGTAPSILASPTNLVTGDGSNVVLFADVLGSPPLTFQWLKDGVAISGATSTTLLLTNVSLTNSAQYQLRVINDFGTNITSKAAVSVAQSPRLRWSNSALGLISSTPAGGAGGRLYFSTSSRGLYAFNIWSFVEWSYIKGVPAGDGASLLSSPAVGRDGTVYIGTQSGKSLAVNSDGSEQWTVYPGGPSDSSPAIGTDGMIYYGNRAMYPDGTARWQLSLSGAVLTSSPAIGADGTIYVCSYGDTASGNKGKLYALNPTGTIKWQFLAGSNVVTSPSIGANGTIYFGSLDRKMYAINPNGTKLWEFLTDGAIQSSAAVGPDGRIYFGNNNGPVTTVTLPGHLYCLDSNGNLVWSFDARMPIHTSPAIAQDGTVYFGSSDGSIYALNSNGTKKWEFPTLGKIEVSPTVGGDGTVYCPSTDNTLYAIQGDAPPANSSWPMYRHDWRHTGNVSTFQDPEPMNLPLTASFFNDQIVASAVVGSNVYVGGTFTLAGGITANSVARWDGLNWHTLDKGITGLVNVMTSIGTNLYVAGSFTNAGSVPAINVARWDGYQWYPMNANPNDDIRALSSLDGVLYAAGYFYFNGQPGISTVASWNGNQWVPFGSPLYSTLGCMAFVGTNLYVGGFGNLGTSASPLNFIARWNGSSWQNLGTGMNDYVHSMTALGGDLYVGGRFTLANGIVVNNIARWNGSNWSVLRNGLSNGGSGPFPNVLCLATNGNQLYLGGYFSSAGGIPANNIASWDGTDFHPLGLGVLVKNFNRTVPIVNSIAVMDSRLFVGGEFLAGGGNTSIRYFGMFDGNTWSAVESKPGFVDGSFRLLLPLGHAPVYGVEASSDLTNWIRVVDFTNSNYSLLFSDAQSSTQKQRFYRIVSP